MRAWIKLACVVLAWTNVPAAVASAGQDRPEHLAQVSTRTINLSFIGADPDAVHAGIRLTIPSPATSPGNGSVPGNPAPHGTASDGTASNGTVPSVLAPASPPAAHASHPSHSQSQSHASSGLPSWRTSLLLAIGLLAVVVFVAEPLLRARRRRRHRGVTSTPPHQAIQATQTTPLDSSVSEIPVMPVPAHEGRIEPTRIVMADHDRLVVTRNKQDDTICVLCPPGEDPADILRVARLVLPEGHYGRLAEQLGLPANWPMNQ